MGKQISDLLGLTLIGIVNEKREVPKRGSSKIIFICDDGREFKMHHYQDCCEGVEVEDIIGYLPDLLGSPITLAEESTNSESHPGGYVPSEFEESYTWTFYRLATLKRTC